MRSVGDITSVFVFICRYLEVDPHHSGFICGQWRVTHPCFFYSIHHMRFRQEQPSAPRKHPSVTTTFGCATVRQMARLSSRFSGYSKLVIVVTQETLIQYHSNQQRLLQIFFLRTITNRNSLLDKLATIEECRWMRHDDSEHSFATLGVPYSWL